jgi:hypothetical protein
MFTGFPQKARPSEGEHFFAGALSFKSHLKCQGGEKVDDRRFRSAAAAVALADHPPLRPPRRRAGALTGLLAAGRTGFLIVL